MKIQIICNSCSPAQTQEDIAYSSFARPCSLDEFDINIVNLQNASIWYYSGDRADSLDNIADFSHLGEMIKNSSKANFVFVLPLNYKFHYNFRICQYCNCVEIKNNLSQIIKILSTLNYIFHSIQLHFEPTLTKIGKEEISADFYLDNSIQQLADRIVRSKSHSSEKITTINVGPNYVTTLNITNNHQLYAFLEYVGLYKRKEELPAWLIEKLFFDDSRNKDILSAQKTIIANAEIEIGKASAILDRNNEYKSILISNGTYLVSIVFNILEELFSCDLSNFIDEKKEDFRLQLADVTFIGEIKGENGGVKNPHISQLINHIDIYKETLDITEDVKGILIINHQRQRPVKEREAVHATQIDKATRDNILIIETVELLSLFEAFLSGTVSSSQCIDAFKKQSGLFNTNQFLEAVNQSIGSMVCK